jgi:hypothetical protein
LVLVGWVLSGAKLAGLAIARTGDDWPWLPHVNEIDALVAGTPGFVLRVTPHRQAGSVAVRCWIAPDAQLGDLVDIEAMARFYRRQFGAGDHLRRAAAIYLPGASDYETTEPEVRGLILGYPPASTMARFSR